MLRILTLALALGLVLTACAPSAPEAVETGGQQLPSVTVYKPPT